MKLGVRSVLSFLACLAVGVAAYLTLTSNQRAGVYPVEADSIGVPLIESIFTSFVIFVLLAAAAGLVALSRFVRRSGTKIAIVFAIVFGLLAALLAAAGAYSWAIPNHYAMALSYVAVTLIALVSSYQDITRVWVANP